MHAAASGTQPLEAALHEKAAAALHVRMLKRVHSAPRRCRRNEHKAEGIPLEAACCRSGRPMKAADHTRTAEPRTRTHLALPTEPHVCGLVMGVASRPFKSQSISHGPASRTSTCESRMAEIQPSDTRFCRDPINCER